MKKLLLFLLICKCFSASAYSNQKAILIANRDVQKDSIGYNVTRAIAAFTYKHLENGDFTLWDSPEKKNKISFADLKGIETSSKTSFLNLENLLIYEEWNMKGKVFKSDVKGFTFTGQDDSAVAVAYGFLEITDSVKRFLARDTMPVNADGCYGLKILPLLLNHQYDFEIVYFGKHPISDLKKSKQIKEKTFANVVIKKNDIFRKEVHYTIEPGASQLTMQSGKLIASLQGFLNRNPQEFFNLGGDTLFSYLKKTNIILTQINVNAVWEKDRDGYHQTILSITPFVLGLPLNTIPIEKLTGWNIQLDNTTFDVALSQNNFYLRLNQLNNTIVHEAYASTYYDGLLSSDWDKIMEYVKLKSFSQTQK